MHSRDTRWSSALVMWSACSRSGTRKMKKLASVLLLVHFGGCLFVRFHGFGTFFLPLFEGVKKEEVSVTSPC